MVSKPPAMMVAMRVSWLFASASEAQLHARRQHVDVPAPTDEVELVAVPVGAQLHALRDGEGRARAIGPAPAALVPAIEQRIGIGAHVCAPVKAAHLAEH